MREYVFTPGATSKSVWFRVFKDDGTINTALVYNSSNLAVTFKRDNGATAPIALASLASETAGYSSGGFIHCGQGLFRLDLPDALIASGAEYVTITIADATDIRAESVVVRLGTNVTHIAGSATPVTNIATAFNALWANVKAVLAKAVGRG